MMNRILEIDDNALHELGEYLGININALGGNYTCKKQALINYIIYGNLESKVQLWFKKYKQIAISYSYSLEKWAIILRENLVKNGYMPIMDQTHIDVSGRSISSFEKILSEQSLLVCIMNEKYLKSFNCMREFYFLCRKYDFNTNEICKHFIAIWDYSINLSVKKINDIAAHWGKIIEQQNLHLSRNCYAIRNKEIAELDSCAIICHHSIDMLYIIKDVSAFRIQDNIESHIPDILNSIDNKLVF